MPDKITIQPRPNHRVGVFVDMQNLYHSAKNLHGARINFAELVKLASANRQIIRALVYVVKSGETDEKAFFDALEKSGLELKMKDLQVFAGGAKKADWDVGMAVDVISLAKQLDVVVLATGDGDFVPLVEYLQHNGVIVEAMSFGRSTSLRLKEVVNNYIDLDDQRKILMGIPGQGPARRSSRGSGRARSTKQSAQSAAPISESFMAPRIHPDEE